MKKYLKLFLLLTSISFYYTYSMGDQGQALNNTDGIARGNLERDLVSYEREREQKELARAQDPDDLDLTCYEDDNEIREQIDRELNLRRRVKITIIKNRTYGELEIERLLGIILKNSAQKRSPNGREDVLSSYKPLYKSLEELLRQGCDSTPIKDFIKEYRKRKKHHDVIGIHASILNKLENILVATQNREAFGICGNSECELITCIKVLLSPARSRDQGNHEREQALKEIIENFAGCSDYEQHTVLGESVVTVLSRISERSSKYFGESITRLKKMLSELPTDGE